MPDITDPAVRYVGCSSSIGYAGHEGLENWRTNFSLTYGLRSNDAQGNHCGRLCLANDDLYLMDRCWNGRVTCGLRVSSQPTHTLIVGQSAAHLDHAPLRAGRYLTVLGPAAALGVAARHGFADRLRIQLGVPVVNLGRGGAGPSDYLTADPELLEPLLAQSAAVIVVLMAGRSSGNSRFPSAVPAMVRFAQVEQLARTDPATTRQLRNESLATAAAEYAQLGARIRARAAALRRRPPALILLWSSECELSSGCQLPGVFPQWYMAPDAAPRAAAAMGATLVDASYAHLPVPYPALSMDQCQTCPAKAGPFACTLDEARRQVSPYGRAPQDWYQSKNRSSAMRILSSLRTNLGCTQTCSSVTPSYYPPDEAHALATAAMMPLIKTALIDAATSERHVRRGDGKGADGGSELVPVPSIDLSQKVFFSHVHKAAGHSFLTFLREAPQINPPLRWCARAYLRHLSPEPCE